MESKIIDINCIYLNTKNNWCGLDAEVCKLIINKTTICNNQTGPLSNSEEIINQISAIRVLNNENWMAILKVAFKYAPDIAGEIMKQITENDAEINKLMKDLTK